MSKFIAQAFGLVIFLYLAVHIIGITNGYMEQQAYIFNRDEFIRRVQEADPADLKPNTGGLTTELLRGGRVCSVAAFNSPELRSQMQAMTNRFSNGVNPQFCLEIIDDKVDEEGKGGTVSYGDRVRIGVSARGSGKFGFVRSQSKRASLPSALQSGQPFYASVREITIQERSTKRVRNL